MIYDTAYLIAMAVHNISKFKFKHMQYWFKDICLNPSQHDHHSFHSWKTASTVNHYLAVHCIKSLWNFVFIFQYDMNLNTYITSIGLKICAKNVLELIWSIWSIANPGKSPFAVNDRTSLWLHNVRSSTSFVRCYETEGKCRYKSPVIFWRFFQLFASIPGI